MLNQITLIGRLVDNPEVFGKEDKKVVTFRLAYAQGINDNGEESTGFIDCKCFRSTAQVVEQWLSKGDKLVVSGSLKLREFTRKDGSKGSTFEIMVNSLEFIDIIAFANKDEVEEEPAPEPKPVAKPTKVRR